WVARLGATAILAATTVMFSGAAAWANSRLEHTNRADGAVLRTPLAEVTLTFNERVHGNFTTVVVTGPGNLSYSQGHVQVIDDVVHQKVYQLRSGAYTVAWRAISADGHPVQGRFAFIMSLPPGQEPTTGPPAATTTAGTRGGPHWWLWGTAAVVVLAALAALVLLPRRRRAAAR